MAAEAIDADIEKVMDVVTIASYGIMSTPSLVIDEKVVSTGRVPSALEIETLLKSS